MGDHDKNMLGSGVYFSHTYAKAVGHGNKHLGQRFVVLKVLMYLGKVIK